MTEGNFGRYKNLCIFWQRRTWKCIYIREKFITKGGPDGGDGGRGGHVIVRGDKNMWTLFHLKFKKHFRADSWW